MTTATTAAAAAAGGGRGSAAKRRRDKSHRDGKQYKTTKDKGDALEQRVIRLMQRLGRHNVQQSVFLTDRFGNRSEIDVVCGWWRFKTYIECKNYAGSVPLKDVAKFKEVLALNNIPLKRGLFITTSTFVPRATTIGVTTIDGEALARWEKRAFAIRALRAARVLTLVTATALVLVDGWDRRYGTSYLPEPLRQPLVTLEQAATKAIKAIKEQLPG